MRLIARDIHRAFPELDAFTDAQCRVYVARVQATIRYQASSFLGFVLGAAIGVPPAAIVMTVGSMMFDGHRQTAGMVAISAVISVVVGLGIPSMLALVGRDQVLRAFVKREIGQARCPSCGYNLLGQRVINRALRCPECGAGTTLDALGLETAECLNPRVACADAPHSDS